ncbi:hypothetical protein RSSM_05337 [Rhodopirellula sallentina SM41]|uniref:Uncharacterized protein n=1 Tax=Rhodopirellula sallentina SM41 TaxID=1263870 RepID=M5UB71_9BACT|nr:hypothetical protein RSSM_05337 [Rhodopirellula sallentina SM41]
MDGDFGITGWTRCPFATTWERRSVTPDRRKVDGTLRSPHERLVQCRH